MHGLSFQTNAQPTTTAESMDSATDPDFEYIKEELKKMGRKPKEVKILPKCHVY